MPKYYYAMLLYDIKASQNETKTDKTGYMVKASQANIKIRIVKHSRPLDKSTLDYKVWNRGGYGLSRSAAQAGLSRSAARPGP